MITLSDLKINCSKRVEREGISVFFILSASLFIILYYAHGQHGKLPEEVARECYGLGRGDFQTPHGGVNRAELL